MVSPDCPLPERVSKQIIRQIFNENHFYEKTLSGEITAMVKRSSHPEPPPEGEPFCTRSQMVWYYDQTNELVAKVHQYFRADGTIGASGKPDPKWLNHEGRRMAIIIEREENRDCK